MDNFSLPAWQKRCLRHTGTQAAMLLFSVLLAEQAVYLLIDPFPLFLPFFAGTIGYQILDGILYTATMLLAVLLGYGFFRLPASHVFPLAPVRRDYLIPAVGAAMGISVPANLLSNLICFYLEEAGLASDTYVPEMAGSMYSLLLNVLFAAVMPAILEELLFRGLVLQSLRKYGDMFAAVCSSILFAVFHTTPGQMLPAFVIGFCMAVFVIRSGSLQTSMCIHLVNNLLSTFLSFADLLLETETVDFFYFILVGILVLWGLVSLFQLRSRFGSAFGLHARNGCILSASEKTFCLLTCIPLLLAVSVFLFITFA